MTERGFSQLLANRKVLVCAGSGGVGKTTIAAALSVFLARRGMNVLTLTIDPAKRLADSMGVRTDCGDRQPVDRTKLRSLGIGPEGGISVLVLDPGRTMNELIAKLAPSVAAREGILNHPLYRYLADYLAGTNEYMAMEKLLSVLHDEDHDILVLDTPPTRHALDFLNAPERLIGAIDSPIMRNIARAVDGSRRFSFDLVAKGVAVMIRGMGKLTGATMLEQIATLIGELNAVFGGFRKRAEQVAEHFRDASFAYLLVTRAERSSVADTIFFAAALRQRGMRADAVIANRIQSALSPAEVEAGENVLKPRLDPELVERVVQAANAESREVQRQRALLSQLKSSAALEGSLQLQLSAIPGGVPDLTTLCRLADEFALRAE